MQSLTILPAAPPAPRSGGRCGRRWQTGSETSRRLREAEPDTAAQAVMDREIAALDRQVRTLETEEVVARFVEDSITASLARAPGDLGEDD